MKKIFLVFVENHGGKHYAWAETIKTGENLKNYIERYPETIIVHVCESATEAAYLAEEWNKAYREKGINLY